jgi:ergothioneine biosynthesis protein EgtB
MAPRGDDLRARYADVRGATTRLVAPLAVEDWVVQSMPDASPAKWHLAHTSWFFEAMVLARSPDHRPFHPSYGFLFNSYYEGLGERHARPARGLLSRPTVDEVRRYRAHVDERMAELFTAGPDAETSAMIELGLQHEQQHQELLLTDVKHALGTQPLRPAYEARLAHGEASADPGPLSFVQGPDGVRWLGAAGEAFSFDNERPRHRVYLEPFALADRLVTCGEYLAFMADGGYSRPDLWLSEGWAFVRAQSLDAPLYWERLDGDWYAYDLGGLARVDRHAPVGHVSHFEADAYARWAGARLPTEAEWESVAESHPVEGHFVEDGALRPRAAAPSPSVRQLFGDTWQWTSSAYGPYPGFRPLAGPAHEYNGKFMCNQMVLRGGSCFTPRSHARATYRNFFPPSARWQMTGIRLARDAG